MREATVGTLPWFAGVFWLVLAGLSHGAASLAFHVGDRVSWLKRPAWWSAWVFISAVNRCSKIAFRCAIEAGAEE